MMKKFKYLGLLLISFASIFGWYACKPATDKIKSPPGYNLSEPEKFNMPESLLEISGIAFNQMHGDTVYSIQDEDGSLFRQKWDDKKQLHVRFSTKGDFEDLALMKDIAFVLKSSGSLYVFPLAERFKKTTENVKEWKKILPKGEYESLYADPVTSSLYLLTKASNEDHKSRHSTGYIFTYNVKTGDLSLSDQFEVSSKEIEGFGFKIKNGLKTSALTRNPKTKEWYILSSVNKLLVVVNADWKVTSVYHLNSSDFNQPEGIAFDNASNLYISNEGDELSSGNILKFKYTPK
jgi:hypothetical protein